MSSSLRVRFRRGLTMLSLILAGEAIFIPPFHLGRYFKSSLLAAFGIDEFQLGQLGAVYGVLAMASYVLGGPLADRFSPRKLLTISLLATALGSLYMATLPGFTGLYLLFGFWGVTTIVAFWAPLIRATREWGGADEQGRAFGILDGGRGLAAAVIATAAAHAYGILVATETLVGAAREEQAVRMLLVGYAGCCCFAALGVWFCVPDCPVTGVRVAGDRHVDLLRDLRRVRRVVVSPAVWLQAIVIIAAYSTFKVFDFYGLYAEDAYGLSRTESAKLIAYLSYLRMVGALAAGWLADRFLGVSRAVQACFALLIASYVTFLLARPAQDLVWLMIANMIAGCLAFFALRGIYFALLEEAGTPRECTGTAVGVICFVGFTPEIFVPPLAGWLIAEARRSGDVLLGYDRLYGILIGLSLLGWLAAGLLRWRRPAERAEGAAAAPGR